MMWLIPKSHNNVANSMSHYDVANSKPAKMRHYLQIQNPLRCGTIYKNCYNAALFTKSVATRHLKARCYTAILYKISKSFSQSPNTCLAFIFTKPKYLFGIYFYKAQIIIWHYFTKPKFLFGIYFYKVQMLIWHYFTKPKY